MLPDRLFAGPSAATFPGIGLLDFSFFFSRIQRAMADPFQRRIG